MTSEQADLKKIIRRITSTRNVFNVNPNKEKTDIITTVKRLYSNTYYHVPFALDCIPKDSNLVYLIIQPNLLTLKETLENDTFLFELVFKEMAKDLNQCLRSLSEKIGIDIYQDFMIEEEREIFFSVVIPKTITTKQVPELFKTEFLNKLFSRIYVDRSSQQIPPSPSKAATVPRPDPQTLVSSPTLRTNPKKKRPQRSPPRPQRSQPRSRSQRSPSSRQKHSSPPPTRGPNKAPQTPDAPSKPGHSDNYKAGVITNIEEYYVWDVRYIHTRLFRLGEVMTMPKLTLLNSLGNKFDFFRSRTLC